MKTRLFYEEPGIRIYHGDARAMREIPCDVPEGARVHVITDPPYSEHVHKKSRRGAGKTVVEARELGFRSLTTRLRRDMCKVFQSRATGWILVFSDLEDQYRWKQDLKSAGLEHVRFGLWRKIGGTPQFTGDRPAVGAEAIEISQAPGFDDAEAIEIAHPPGRKKWNGGGKHGVWWDQPIASGFRHHTTEKPIGLIRQLIQDFTNPGDIIWDPFLGGGTLLVAARELGRLAIGIELQKNYCEVSRERLRQQVLFTPTAPPVPTPEQPGLFEEAG